MTRGPNGRPRSAARDSIAHVPGVTKQGVADHGRLGCIAFSALAISMSTGCEERAAAGSRPDATLAVPTVVAALSEDPVVDIGLADGDPVYLLHLALSSVRLQDGRIIVLNAGSHELRFYDGEGRHVGSTGGKGDGPGEFRRPARIHLTHPDTLVVFDPGADRESVFDAHGRFVRATPAASAPDDEPFPREAWLYGRAFIDGPARIVDREPVRAVIDALPPAPAGSPFHFVLVDGRNRIWVRGILTHESTPTEWHVYAVDGAPLARVTTPPSFELQHIGDDFLLGRTHDAMNVEHIRLYGIRNLPAATGTAHHATDTGHSTSPRPSEAALDQVRSVLRIMMAKQEIFYSMPANGYRYASRMDQLTWPEDTPEVVAHILNAGPAGWSAIVLHTGEGFLCGVSQGSGGPVGWTPGIVLCP